MYYKSLYWDFTKNIGTPREYFISSGKEFWFNCDRCNNNFKNKLNHISSGTWCNKCFNKTEYKLYENLKILYENITFQYRVEWCKNKSYLPYDFCIEENKIIIELDGPQHFIQVSNWSSPEEQLKNDKYKEKCANDNGYSIIRVLQEDVLCDKYDWKTELINNIEKIKKDNIIQNIYMCKNNEYENFMN